MRYKFVFISKGADHNQKEETRISFPDNFTPHTPLSGEVVSYPINRGRGNARGKVIDRETTFHANPEGDSTVIDVSFLVERSAM